MKKLYLFSVGLMLATLPMSAQEFVEEGPTRTPQDPDEVFFQGFEADWKTWCETPVGSIDTIWYYDHVGDASQTTIKDEWMAAGLIPRTDSVLTLYNGVKTSDNEKDKAGNAFQGDVYTIIEDQSGSERQATLNKLFGIDVGSHYFRYKSDYKYANTSDAYTNGVVANYRRNLFVRGLPVDANSSYRLTLFLKTNCDSLNVQPTFYADVMRGYQRSEKPFYTGSNTFEYEKTEFSGDWEKVTFMTYYINNEVQEKRYNTQYYWAGDEWGWNRNGDGNMYYFIKQPDRYFVRLSFASDYTEFLLDNISLTKSWIGGVEYSGNQLRVNFGYETNLNQLAAEALERTNIPVVQVPGGVFDVLGYYEGTGADDEAHGWWRIPIRTAEYHEDGYMYMWTENDEEGDAITFDYYDTVLVSFNNTDDPTLQLKYSSDKYYPMADQTEWVEAGKIVPPFYNEVATLNPYVFEGVKPYDQLPPVWQVLPWENGSFGLDGNFSEFTVKFSTPIIFDPNVTEASDNAAFCRVTGPTGKEIWKVLSSDKDGYTVFARPADKTAVLSGDYQFEFLYIINQAGGLGKSFTVNYHFGDFDKNPAITTILQTDWSKEVTANLMIPVSLVSSNGKDGFVTGAEGKSGTKCNLHLLGTSEDNLGLYDCAYYISGREKNTNGHLYYGLMDGHKLTLKKGKYSVNFKAMYWNSSKMDTKVYVYKNTFADPKDVQNMPADSKTLIGEFEPVDHVSYSKLRDGTGRWPDDAKLYEYEFSIPEDGDYVLEWEVKINSTEGTVLSNFNITTVGDLSFPYVTKLNRSVAAAQEKLTAAEADAYGKNKPYVGEDYNTVKELVDMMKVWAGHAPSEYNANAAEVDAAAAVMQARIDTVDLYYSTEADAVKKIHEYDSLVTLQGLEAYKKLVAYVNEQSTFNCPDYANADITEAIKGFNDAVAALETRQAIIDKWDEKLAEIKALLEDSLAQKGIPEYATMKRVYDQAVVADLITPSDEEFTQLYNSIVDGKNGYVFKVDYIAAKTRQAKELAALATKLGYEIPADLKDKVAALEDEDAKLEEVLRDAAILQIYKKFAEGDALVDEDVSALVPNYFLYNEAQVDRDMDLNSDGKWRIIKNKTNTTAFPHWTITSTSGDWFPCKEKADANNKLFGQLDWEVDGHIFDGGLRCGPTTQGTVTSTVEGLPAAYYWVGFYGYNQTSNFFFGAIGDSTSYNEGLSTATGKFGYKAFGADSIKTASKITYSIKQSSSSTSEADIRYFILKIRGLDEGVNYADLIPAQEQKLAGEISFVAPAAQEVDAKFYNLNGMEMTAPKAGQIMIRQTVGKNGAAKTEKILVK